MKRKIVDFMTLVCCMAVSCLSLASCDSELDVQQEYPFTVESMPVVGKIADGETVEIRLEIKAEGNFSGTVYTLRYFQPDGKGSLKMEDGTVLKPNDRYLLNERRFRCTTPRRVRTRHRPSTFILRITGGICRG